LVKKKWLGERQPAFKGHHDGHPSGIRPKEPQQDNDPTRPYALLDVWPSVSHKQMDHYADEHD